MVTLRTCTTLTEAEVIRSQLEGSGIEAFLPDEFAAQNAWATLDGVRVQVADEDEKRAEEILRDKPDPAA